MWPHVTEPEPQRRPPAALTSGRKPRVLLAEDDPDMRRLVGWVLRRDGYEVAQVPNGMGLLSRVASANSSARDVPFDVILADVIMPDLTAFDVLEALRCRDIATPIVLMTAYGAARARVDAAALGAHDVLDKPLDWDRLRAAVREAVSLASRASCA